MNILFLGAGKRVTMSKIFTDNGFTVFSYETDYNLPISKYAKIILGKKWKDPEIIQHLRDIVDQYKIQLIIPFQDAAIELCDQLKVYCNVLASNEETAKICHNKKKLEEFMLINFPEIYPTELKNQKRIYKPINGFGGKGIIQSDTELHLDNYVCQRVIQGIEYSVDCFSDKKGKLLDCVCRKRLEVCCGEVSKSETIFHPDMVHLVKNLAKKLNIIGPSNFQFIQENNTDKLYLIEINCRFGGGFTFSYEAGLDFIQIIKNDYFNEKSEYIAKPFKQLHLIRYYEDYTYEKQENSY